MKILFIVLLLTSFGCSDRGPKKIKSGSDVCAFCQMTIVDERFSAQLITDKNKAYLFDDLKCLNNFIEAKEMTSDNTKQIYVANFHSPDSYLEFKTAFFLHSEEWHSPMGGNIAAFPDTTTRNDAMTEMGGETISFDQVIIYP